MHKFKVGDRVQFNQTYGAIKPGDTGTVISSADCANAVIGVRLLSGKRIGNSAAAYAYRLDFAPSAAFIINGAPKEYPTLEAAEAGVKAIGNNGVTYEIAHIVKRVTVKRETVVTLEEAV